MTVRMFQPHDVRKAFQLAKLYESTSASHIPTKTFPTLQNNKILQNPFSLQLNLQKPPDSHTPLNTNHKQPPKNLTTAFMSERRSKGICYFCEEPYTPTHALTHKKLEIHVIDLNDMAVEPVDEFEDTQEEDSSFMDPQISVNALTGITSYKTMKGIGYYKKKPLHILIDSRSAHNFLDEDVAKKLGCPITHIPTLSVAVADGARVTINSIIKQFSWSLHNTEFSSEMLLIPLGCCDVVLGIEWLRTLGDITWNFDRLSMQFYVHGKKLFERDNK